MTLVNNVVGNRHKYLQDTIAGVVIIDTPMDVKHEGVFMTIEGAVDLQISTQNVGAFDAFYNSVKVYVLAAMSRRWRRRYSRFLIRFQPVQLMMCSLEIARAGRFPCGVTEIPFEAPVMPLLNKVLYESYHGVFINIQYLLKAVIKRNFLNKDIHKMLEFVVENNVGKSLRATKTVPHRIIIFICHGLF